MPSSVNTSRTADENGHHSVWYSVTAASATETILLVRAVAEGLVARTAAAAERRLVAFVEDGALTVEDAHASRDEQRSVLGGANLERLFARRGRNAEPACSQGAGRTSRHRGLHLVCR